MRASGELLVIRYRLGVAVVLDVRFVDSGRHEVVVASRYEQQRRPILVAEVYVGVLVSRREVGQHPTPEESAWCGDVVALVDLPGFFLGESIGEGVVELLGGEGNGLVAVGGVPQDGEACPDLRDWHNLDALCRHGVYGHASSPVAVV